MESSEIQQVRDLAIPRGWKEIDHQLNIGMISFKRGDVRVNYYYTTRTIATSMNHPIKGKTQLYRRNISKSELKCILEWPRAHTGKGYYRL